MKEYKSLLPEITLKYKKGETKKYQITTSRDTNDILKVLFNTDTVELCEECLCIFLNRNNNTIGWWRVSQGGMTGTVVDVRLILVTALNCGATAIILAHNHPSGNIKPSDSDIKITRKVKEGCKALDITLLDHIIYTTEGYYSFADEGLI